MAAWHASRNCPEGHRPALLTLLGGLLLAASANLHARDAGAGLRSGEAVYDFYCYQCHAYAGNAATLASTYLDPAPRDFTASDPSVLTRARMIESVSKGRPGTAMVAFSEVLADEEIAAVVDYVRARFMDGNTPAALYHTAENGWPDHARYADAFPFAAGELPLDSDWEQLTETQRRGKRLFMAACISCHDRARVSNEGPVWELRALSYPRKHYDHTRPPDLVSAASPYALHDRPPDLDGLSAMEQQGAQLFQDNCAFCHAADASGRNWIGSFLEPRPRDLTSPIITDRDESSLLQVIRDGLPNTSMPAWKGLLGDGQIRAIIAWLQRDAARAGTEPPVRIESTAFQRLPGWKKYRPDHDDHDSASD